MAKRQRAFDRSIKLLNDEINRITGQFVREVEERGGKRANKLTKLNHIKALKLAVDLLEKENIPFYKIEFLKGKLSKD
jgi:hypothetical protein